MEINNLERFLEKARTAGPALGACITFSDPAVTEVACASGLDFVWIDGEHGEEEQLLEAYQSALALAESLGCRSVAFPLLKAASGVIV